MPNASLIEYEEILIRRPCTYPTNCGLETFLYPAGEPGVRFNFSHFVERILLRPKTLSSLVTALFWVDSLKAYQSAPELILPYFPGGRQDRPFTKGDVLFTARSVANMINERKFPSVVVFDPHSDVTSALLHNCKVVTAKDILSTNLSNLSSYDAVVAPDAGARKRAESISNLLNLPTIQAWKTRSVSTGEITGFGLEPCKAKRVLVVDDICDGGRTFVGLGWLLREKSMRAELYTTHGIYSNGTSELLKYYDRLICTDSFLSSSLPHRYAKEEVPYYEMRKLLNREFQRIVILPSAKNLFEE